MSCIVDNCILMPYNQLLKLALTLIKLYNHIYHITGISSNKIKGLDSSSYPSCIFHRHPSINNPCTFTPRNVKKKYPLSGDTA